MLEGALIIVAAMLIFREAYVALSPRARSTEPAAGLMVNGLATAINAGWAWVLISRGKAWSSPALEGDGHHLVSDVITSVGVLAGLLLATLTGWAILDPLIAGRRRLQHPAHRLPAGGRIHEPADGPGRLAGDRGAHQGRHPRQRRRRAAGARHPHPHGRAADIHRVSPRRARRDDRRVRARICDRLEDAIEAELANTDVVIHVEPDHKAKRKGAVEL